jgi:predicted FMN-binding regulatory protein PaiB
VHVFDEYRAPSPAAVADLVRAHPFALVVSTAGDPAGPVPEATHLPVVPAPGADLSAGLAGVTLWSHMARVNPQWEHFVDGARVLVVFTGADGYVSPTTYGTTPAAPTWNYAAVHAVGRVRLLTDPEAALSVVTTTVSALEDGRPQPWDMTGSLGWFRRILPGIVAFAVEVESARAVFKMSQDKPAELRARVRAEFAGAPGTGPEVAATMDASPPGGGRGGPPAPR